jgi:hypothetical protein
MFLGTPDSEQSGLVRAPTLTLKITLNASTEPLKYILLQMAEDENIHTRDLQTDWKSYSTCWEQMYPPPWATTTQKTNKDDIVVDKEETTTTQWETLIFIDGQLWKSTNNPEGWLNLVRSKRRKRQIGSTVSRQRIPLSLFFQYCCFQVFDGYGHDFKMRFGFKMT